MSEIHERIELKEVPTDSDGNTLLNLYVLLPSSRRYVVFVSKGDSLNPEKQERLKNHALPNIFVLPSELKAALEEKNTKKVYADHPDGFHSEVLGKEAKADLKKIYNILMGNSTVDQKLHSQILQESADKILSIVAPESKELRDTVVKSSKYVHLMNDSSAITTLSVLFAFANGFDSRKSYFELTCAALVMDVSLDALSPKERELSLTFFSTLPKEVQKTIQNHPIKSHQLVSERIPNLSDTTMQLILNHHELFNGKGYPRGIRSESLFPLVKILSFSVDVYERLRKAEILKQPLDILSAVKEIHDEKVEAHLRRHNRKISQKIIELLGGAPTDSKAA
ncbi:MAG: hypothetical protein KA116_04075 [Proteobacteria bacterium]|nr:hypothetical protein [Pseudomonadota bacterium]